MLRGPEEKFYRILRPSERNFSESGNVRAVVAASAEQRASGSEYAQDPFHTLYGVAGAIGYGTVKLMQHACRNGGCENVFDDEDDLAPATSSEKSVRRGESGSRRVSSVKKKGVKRIGKDGSNISVTGQQFFRIECNNGRVFRYYRYRDEWYAWHGVAGFRDYSLEELAQLRCG